MTGPDGVDIKEMVMARKSVLDLHEMKRRGEKITWLTAYDYPTASFEAQAGIDMILVGDSLGMCIYGYSGTVPVTMDQCIVHTEAVRRAAPNVFLLGDMPFMSYQISDEEAVRNAGRSLQEADVDAIKLEGGVRVASRIKAIRDAGIVVCGHIGLTPQSSGQLGGHKAQGRTRDSAQAVVEDARAVYEAGAQLLLIEAVPPEVAGFIRAELPIPVIGLGAGTEVDGQLLIELLSLTREHVIAVFVRRECPGANVCHVLSQGSSSDAGDVGVFLYELGREGLENT